MSSSSSSSSNPPRSFSFPSASSLDIQALSHIFPEESSYSKDYTWTVIAGVAILGLGRGIEGAIRELAVRVFEETKEQEEGKGDGDAVTAAADRIAKGNGNGIMQQDAEGENTTNSDANHDPSPSASTRTASLQVQLHIFRRLRSAPLKISPIIGLPLAINGLSTLHSTITSLSPPLSSLLTKDATTTTTSALSLPDRRARGLAFFEKVYERHTQRILKSMDESSGGVLGRFALESVYGDLVGDVSLVGEKETSLCEFVACLTLGEGAEGQSKGHMYGARNLGNTGAEIRAAIEMVRIVARQLAAPWSGEGMTFLEKARDW